MEEKKKNQHARSNMTTPLRGQQMQCPDTGVAMPSEDEVLRAKQWVDEHEV